MARNNQTSEVVAVKLVAKLKDANHRLEAEYQLYRRLGAVAGLPTMYHYGECGAHNALVMELLGPNLEQYFQSCNRKLSVRTTTQLGLKIIEIVHYLHDQGLIVCNIKPENFCLGPPKSARAESVYMIGLNNSKECAVGTPRYMSLNAHQGKALGRRDDLESIGYMLIYFMLGRLPWQGVTGGDQAERYERIHSIKKCIRLCELCHNTSSEYYHYMLYVRTLHHDHHPNYRYITHMWTQLIHTLSQHTTTTHNLTKDATSPSEQHSRKQVSFSAEPKLLQ